MDLEYTPAEEAFRSKVRTWLEKNAPQQKGALSLEEGKAWQRKLHEGGFLGAAGRRSTAARACPTWSRRS